MTQFDVELSPPFTIVEPATWRAPIIFNSPHSGSVYPKAFLSASRVNVATLRRSEDSFVDELIAGLSAQGFPVVSVHFPRSYVDVNREPYELDPRMFSGRLPSFANTRSMRVAGGLGTIPRVVGDGQEIYHERLDVDDALGRIEALYKPYHRALRRLIAKAHTSLTSSRRCTGLASTLAFFGAAESEFSATAAKPVMNMILISGSSSEARRASSMPSISGITISVSSISNGSSRSLW